MFTFFLYCCVVYALHWRGLPTTIAHCMRVLCFIVECFLGSTPHMWRPHHYIPHRHTFQTLLRCVCISSRLTSRAHSMAPECFCVRARACAAYASKRLRQRAARSGYPYAVPKRRCREYTHTRTNTLVRDEKYVLIMALGYERERGERTGGSDTDESVVCVCDMC